MKKKITISLPVNSLKCRAKAMEIAVSIAGVISVTSDADKNQLVVTGDGVDSYALMKCLRKKFRCASIISIEDVKPAPAPAPPPPPSPKCECCRPCPCPPGYYNPCVIPVYDSNPNCSIQ